MSLSIPQGSDYAFAFLHPTGTGGSTLTVSSPGLASMQVQVAVVPGPLQVRLLLNSAPLGFIYQNQTATFEFTATFVGQPVRNVNVTWTTTGGGELTPAKGNTGSSGTTGSVFTPTSFGAYNVTASADSPLTGAVLLVYHLTVAQVVAKPGPSLVQQILGYWYYLVAAAAVVVIAVVYLFRMRRKRQRAEIEAGFEVV